ncbi:THUMP-like domain-containing protein [Nonlabens marinus]|uniref:SAM-dependent methyltransferases n=1 Tax=Nonlabens marinus S1-08 TaxID=1454201 RepID=W8VW06_9FLAO|nr:RsmD family RNA methyltransferase [Nonlabens marinus]BAO55913.1 SAM-dependent methyltransferases [Nonlabens marinus S1-08]
MNLKVLQPQVREYLMEHLHESPAGFILKSHPFEIEVKDLTQQLIGLQKARYKFPLLFEHREILFPPKVNLEQTSSASTAAYKAQITQGNSMIDLTGGLGVDVIAFAKAYSQTTHVERDKSLQEITAHNLSALQLPTKSVCEDGIAFLRNTDQSFDLIYLDPSRKTAASSKAVLLTDYEPNVLEHIELLFDKSDQILIKTSPMLDITAGLQQLPNVVEIHVVAVKNEVKELLWLLNKKDTSLTITAVNLETDQPKFSYSPGYLPVLEFSEVKAYVYEPNAAVMKTQAFAQLAEEYKIQKIDQDAHLLTSEEFIDFPGRIFKVKKTQDYKPKSIKREYGKGAHAVVTRNFRESVKQIRTKYNFTESEFNYLFFTSINGRGAVVIEAEKWNP